jgi:hypothetical protein
MAGQRRISRRDTEDSSGEEESADQKRSRISGELVLQTVIFSR